MSKKKSIFDILKPKKKNLQKEKKLKSYLIVTKLFLVLTLVLGLFYFSLPFTNEINLLAVSEDDSGKITSGSLVKLSLTTKSGSGNIYVNLNTIGETDTQISIINSQKIACNLFELDCSKYDFFYEFSDNDAIVLKGPSASSAIAILVAKNLKKEKINSNEVVMTGSLNPGGLIGLVGGVDKKIEIANKFGFSKVLIPIFADINLTNNDYNIEVIEIIDIVDAYNEFEGSKFEIKNPSTNNVKYDQLMRELANELCLRTDMIRTLINESQISENTSQIKYLNNALKSYNSSQIAMENSNYYSAGSFCFNSNINFRTIASMQENITLEERNALIDKLKLIIYEKINHVESETYMAKIQSINDLYVYLLINDRLYESRDLIESLDELDSQKETILSIINITNVSINENTSNIILNKTEEKINLDKIKFQKDGTYSYALERLNTVFMWEKFITHEGTNIIFSENEINLACNQISKQILLKAELLDNYGVTFFDEDIHELLVLEKVPSKKYLCVYKGLELDGRINTVLSSSGIKNEEVQNYTNDVLYFTNSRVNLNSNGNFPLIPTIYNEYAKDLYNQGDYSTALLYSNYALSYSDLNLYLSGDYEEINYYYEIFNQLFSNVIFIFGILLIIAFL